MSSVSSPSSSHSEPRWLSDSEKEAWLALAGVLTRLPSALNARMQRSSEISLFEYRLLSALSEAPHYTLNSSFLIDYLQCEHPQLSQVLTRLAKRGLVHRKTDLGDKRRRVVTLSRQGMELVVAAAPDHVEAVRTLVIDAVGSQFAEPLREGCTRILEALGAPGAENLRRGLGPGNPQQRSDETASS